VDTSPANSPDPHPPAPPARLKSVLPACLIAALLVLAGVIKWRAYEKPNAIQQAAHHAALLVLLAVWAGQRRAATLDRALAGPAWVQPESLLAALALLYAASPLWGASSWLAGLGAAGMIPNILWALLAATLCRPDQAAAIILAGAGASGLVLAAFTFYDARSDPVSWLWQRQGHPNLLACCLLPSFFACAALAALARRNAWRLLAVALAVLPACVFVAASAIGAWVGLAAGCAAGALCFVRTRPRRRLLLAAALLAAVAALAPAAIPSLSDLLAPTLLRSRQATRFFHLLNSAEMLAHRPWLGWGPGAFMSCFSLFKSTAAPLYGWQTSLTLHPHNEPILVAIDTGLAGLLLYAAAAAACVLRAWEAAQRASSPRRWLIAACLGGWTATFVHGFFEIALRYWGPMAMHWTFWGLALALSAPPKDPPPSIAPRARRARGLAALAGSLALAGAITIPGQTAHFLMGRAEDLAMEGKLDQALAAWRAARPLSRFPSQFVSSYQRPAEELLKAGRTEPALQAFEDLERVAPNLGPSRLILGQLYAGRARAPKHNPRDASRALACLRDYAARRPDSAAAQCAYARALLDLRPNALPLALTRALYAAGIPPPDPASWTLVGECHARSGRLDLAESAFGKAVEICQAQMSAASSAPGAPAQQAARRRLAQALLQWARAAAHLGRYPAARQRLERAAPLAAGDPQLLAAIARLQSSLPSP